VNGPYYESDHDEHLFKNLTWEYWFASLVVKPRLHERVPRLQVFVGFFHAFAKPGTIFFMSDTVLIWKCVSYFIDVADLLNTARSSITIESVGSITWADLFRPSSLSTIGGPTVHGTMKMCM